MNFLRSTIYWEQFNAHLALTSSLHYSNPETGMADRCNELEELRTKVLTLQQENDKACAQLVVTQGENARLRSQLTHQSTFCASLGSVLGTLVWKASRVPPVVDLLLSGVSGDERVKMIN